MPFVFWNVSDVTVNNFYVVQPQLWSINIINGTDMTFDNIYTNATSPEAPEGWNWVQNTDGFSKFTLRFSHTPSFQQITFDRSTRDAPKKDADRTKTLTPTPNPQIP
jgi:hypothetical protein